MPPGIKQPTVIPPAPIPSGVYIYILARAHGAYYVGSARNVARRLAQHRAGLGARFTRDRGDIKLVYVEGPFDGATAIAREAQLKRWSHAKKAALIRGDLLQLRALSQSHD